MKYVGKFVLDLSTVVYFILKHFMCVKKCFKSISRMLVINSKRKMSKQGLKKVWNLGVFGYFMLLNKKN